MKHELNTFCDVVETETQYVVSVRAFNNVGKGPVVYDLIYTTDTPAGNIPLHSSMLPTTAQLGRSNSLYQLYFSSKVKF